MEGASPLYQKRVVRYLVRQPVLESVFKIREQASLVEKLDSLKTAEVAMEFFFWHLNDSLEQGERHALPDPLMPESAHELRAAR